MQFQSLYLLAILLLITACSNSDPGVIVQIELWPTESAELRVRAELNGVSEELPAIHPDQPGFIVRVAPGQSGELVLDTTVLDRTGCKLATGRVTASLGGGLHPTQELTLRLKLLPEPLCTLTVQVEEGAGSVVSKPPGLSVTGMGTFEADFPRGSAVTLDATATSLKQPAYYLFSGDCAGTTDCVVDVDRPRQVRVIFAPRICSQDGLCWQNPVPQGNPLLFVWQDPAGPAWAVGQRGTVLKCSGYSCFAVQIENGLGTQFNDKATLWSVWAQHNDAIWVVGDGGTLLMCSNISNTCSVVDSSTKADLFDVWVDSDGTVFAVGAQNTVVKCSDDSGSGKPHCISSILPAPRNDFNVVQGNSQHEVWAAGTSGIIYRYNNTAKSWQKMDLFQFDFKTQTWNPPPSSFKPDLNAISGNDSGEIVLAGATGTIVKCSSSYIPACRLVPQVPESSDLGGIWESQSGEIWAVGALGAVVRCPAAPLVIPSCTSISTNTVDYLRDVGGDRLGTVTIIGDNGALFECRESTCTPRSSGLSNSLFSLSIGDRGDRWAIGDNGALLRCNAGICGPISYSAGAAALAGIHLTGSGEAWAAGSGGSIVKCSSSGCDAIASGTASDFTGLWGNNKLVWAIGTFGKIFRCYGQTCSAYESNSMDTLNSIWGDNRDRIFAVGGLSTVSCEGSGTCNSVLSDRPAVNQLGVWGSAGHLWVAADQGYLFHWQLNARDSTVGALSINKPPSAVQSVWVHDNGDSLSVGENGSIIKCSPGTAGAQDTCSSISIASISQRLFKVRGESNIAWILGDSGTILVCNYISAGDTFTCNRAISPPGVLVTDLFISNGTAFIATDAGVLVCKSSPAPSCQLLTSNTDLQGVSGWKNTNTGSTEIWTAGRNGAILRYSPP